jgi:hypothetical protein
VEQEDALVASYHKSLSRAHRDVLIIVKDGISSLRTALALAGSMWEADKRDGPRVATKQQLVYRPLRICVAVWRIQPQIGESITGVAC